MCGIARGYDCPSIGVKALPVVRFQDVTAPFVVCVAMGRTDGALEANIASLGFEEGVDYWHFS